MSYYELNLQRKQEIEDGLLTLLQSTPFVQITITDLTRHLGISRKSFYHYFPNREACMDSLIERKIQEAALYVASRNVFSHYSLEGYIVNLEFWKSQAPFLNAIAQNELDTVFLHKYIAYNMKENKTLPSLTDTENPDIDEDILLFYASGQLTLLMHWCQRGFSPPVEEMARKFLRLLGTPLIHTEEK